jgi:hypothetical protein
MCIIPDDVPLFHPVYSHSILYVGRDLALLKSLQGEFKECRIVRCPDGSTGRVLIASDIKYLLLLFDEQLLDTTGKELERFARSVAHREGTRVIIFSQSGDFKLLARAVKRSLNAWERQKWPDNWWQFSRRHCV